MILEVLKKYLGKLASEAGSAIMQFMEVEILQLLVAVGDAANDELKLRNSPVIAQPVADVNKQIADKVVSTVDKISSKDDK